jgi:hypothetical protein
METEIIPAEIKWINKNKEYLSLLKIEKACGMAQNTLCAYLKGQRPLSEHWNEPLIKWVKEFTKITK